MISFSYRVETTDFRNMQLNSAWLRLGRVGDTLPRVGKRMANGRNIVRWG